MVKVAKEKASLICLHNIMELNFYNSTECCWEFEFEYDSIQFKAGEDIVTRYIFVRYSSYFEHTLHDVKSKLVTYSHNINPA